MTRPSAALLAHRAANARVFGSVLHGDDSEESDLDMLVDALPSATLLDFGAIQVALEDLPECRSTCWRRRICRQGSAAKCSTRRAPYEC